MIGGSSTGLPRVLDIALRGVPAARTGGPVFGLVHALLTGFLPVLLLPLVGWVVDRWGPRRLVWWGLVALAVGAVLYLGYRIGAVLFVSVAVVSVGSVFGTQLPIAAAVNNWFQRRKAMAMAVMMVPSVTASFVFDVLRTVVVIHPRLASLIVAGTVLMLALPLSRLVKNRPEDDGWHPDGVVAIVPGDGQPGQSDNEGTLLPDYTWREALRARAFWMLAVAGTVLSISSSGFFSLLIMRDLGFAPGHSVAVLSLGDAFTAAFVLAGGWIGDRVPIRRAMFVFGLAEAAAIGVLCFAGTLPMFCLSAALAGIGAGGRIPLTLAAHGVYFGRRNFATITGVTLMALNLAGEEGFGSILVIWLVELAGSYALPLAVIALVGAAASSVFLFMGDPKPAPSQS